MSASKYLTARSFGQGKMTMRNRRNVIIITNTHERDIWAFCVMYTHTHTHTENEKQNTQKDEKNRRKGPTTQNRRREAAHIKLADKWVRMYAKNCGRALQKALPRE